MSKDQFSKSKAIRRGELDGQRPTLEEMSGWFQRVPKTVLASVLRKLLAACVRRKVFDGNELLEFVRHIETKYSDPNWMLRKK